MNVFDVYFVLTGERVDIVNYTIGRGRQSQSVTSGVILEMEEHMQYVSYICKRTACRSSNIQR
jgi:hypothetical protein